LLTPGGENCLIQLRVLAAKRRTLKTGDHPRSSGVVQYVGFQPVLLFEKCPKRQSDLSMLIAFRPGAGTSGHIAECYAGAQQIPPCCRADDLERFQAKWRPVRVKKTRQIKNLEPRFDSIETEKALAPMYEPQTA
jgi:hypothetical protein